MSRRRRGRDEYVEEVIVVEEGPYYEDERYEEEESNAMFRLVGFLLVVLILGSLFYWLVISRPKKQRMARQQDSFQSVPIGKPIIDLKSVEQALWSTKSKDPKDFKGWMQKFEDEVNAIYFTTLRQENPKADPASLMKSPVRVDPQKKNGLLYLYGYQDENKKPGYQNGEDKLLFVFEQTKPYNSQQKQLSYSLRDSGGYYYREPSYTHTVAMASTAMFLGFFVYPTIWYGMYYRPMFGWWGTPYWRSGGFYNRYSYYTRRYPSYTRTYRRTYYKRSRPWGWNRGSYYRKDSRGRYRSPGTSRNRYRSSGRNRYRRSGKSGTSRNRYRRSGKSGTSRNRYRRSGKSGTSRNRYRRPTRRTRYRRSGGGRYRRSGGSRRR